MGEDRHDLDEDHLPNRPHLTNRLNINITASRL
jgi:hypothetical protein